MVVEIFVFDYRRGERENASARTTLIVMHNLTIRYSKYLALGLF